MMYNIAITIFDLTAIYGSDDFMEELLWQIWEKKDEWSA